MNYRLRNILAICIGVLPAGLIMLWYRLTHSESFALTDMLVYPMVVGIGNILLILALNKYLPGQKASSLSPGKGKWYFDIIAGLANNPLLLAIWLGPVAWIELEL